MYGPQRFDKPEVTNQIQYSVIVGLGNAFSAFSNTERPMFPVRNEKK